MSIVIDHVTKRYDDHAVVRDASVEIQDGEFFVLLGPSGSGKSTLLRIIAGLTEADTGRVLLHGRDVTNVPPQSRGVGFVFQSYALFRHMTAAENVEFPLRVRKVAAGERRRRRDELLDLVGLAGMGDRRPGQLSGGQQQRVALARALAHRPEVLLLDEPFGALDAQIRAELRRTVRAIQRELGMTTVFVTHDQEEAFELADRLAVLEGGRLLEVGASRELYMHPETEFVATFLGNANLFVGECTEKGVRVGHIELPISSRAGTIDPGGRVQVLVRPEDVAVKDSPDALQWPLLGRATVESRSFVGTFERLQLRIPPLAGVRAIAPPAPFGADYLLIDAARSQHQARRFPLEPGQEAWVGIRRFHALVHPGLQMLVPHDGSDVSRAGLQFGAALAARARARLTVLCSGIDDAAGEKVRAGLQRDGAKGVSALEVRTSLEPMDQALATYTGIHSCDLVVTGINGHGGAERAQAALASGGHHVLVVPGQAQLPRRVLLCVARGEQGKEDVELCGRLSRHLGAEVTVLTVLPEEERSGPAMEQAQRYLAAAERTLHRFGLAATTLVRHGNVLHQIRDEVDLGKHDLLVLGAPVDGGSGRPVVTGVIAELLRSIERPALIVRSTRVVP